MYTASLELWRAQPKPTSGARDTHYRAESCGSLSQCEYPSEFERLAAEVQDPAKSATLRHNTLREQSAFTADDRARVAQIHHTVRVERFFVRDFEGWFLAVVRALVRVVICGCDKSLCHGCSNGSATRGKKPLTNTGGVARFTQPTRTPPVDQPATMGRG